MRLQSEIPLESPLCRHRVLYIGSKTPPQVKNGLESIQEPLKLLYSTKGITNSSGIDAWLTVLPDGLQLDYVEDSTVKIHFPIQNLHYCAAVRFVNAIGYYSNVDVSQEESVNEKFLPLDNPLANLPTTEHPPIFVAILRKCKGLKLLECFAFICTTAEAANSFVRFCFHAYADNMYLNLRTENGAKIGKVGELSFDDDLQENEPKEKDKGDNENLNGDDSRCLKPEPSSTVESSSDISIRSKASRRWSNVKAKYSNKLQKKNSTDKFDPDKIEIHAPESPEATVTKSDTLKNSFWKNKKQRSQSELNLNATIGNVKNARRMIPLRLPIAPARVSKMDTTRFYRMVNGQYPDSRYSSVSSFVPTIIAAGPNPCHVYEVPIMAPHHVLKLMPMSSIVSPPPTSFILYPPSSASVQHPLFIANESDNYKMHRSMYDIPYIHKVIDEPMYQNGAYFEGLPNSYSPYSSANVFDDRIHRKVLGTFNKSTGKDFSRTNKSDLRKNIVYQKGFFGQYQMKEKAFATISSKQKNKPPNNVSQIFSDDDDALFERYLEHNYSQENNHCFEYEKNKSSHFSKNIEERIGTMNISDGDDDEY